jgi:hypothetical protein
MEGTCVTLMIGLKDKSIIKRLMTIYEAAGNVSALLGEQMDILFFYLGLEEDLEANLNEISKTYMKI